MPKAINSFFFKIIFINILYDGILTYDIYYMMIHIYHHHRVGSISKSMNHSHNLVVLVEGTKS